MAAKDRLFTFSKAPVRDHSAITPPTGFFNEIAKDQDKRKICGFSLLYSLIHLLQRTRDNQLHYGQAFTPETGSAVTFTSMMFE